MKILQEIGFIVGMVIVAVASAFTIKIINELRERKDKEKQNH